MKGQSMGFIGLIKKYFLPGRKQNPECGNSVYVVFDIETTGLSRTEDRIIEIAANKYADGVLVEEYHTYVNPGFHIPATVTRLTGISDETVADAPSILDVKDRFLSFIGSALLVGHNITVFDIPFIQAQMGITVRNTIQDTLKISRKVFPGLPSYKLSYLDQALRLGGNEHHRASNDVVVNNALYIACNNPKLYRRILSDKDRLAKIEIEPRRTLLLYEKVDIHSIVPSCDCICQTGLTGKCVVFTGELVMTRREAMQKAVDAGAILKRDVSNKVDYLVVGDQDKRLVGATGKSNNQRYADELIEKGNKRLKIIGEAEFLDLLKPIN